jgi:osmotically-inducible protein OsmY
MYRELSLRSAPEWRSKELRAAAAASLFHSGYTALSRIGCDVLGDRIILQGSVPSYHLKQMAQATVQRVAGVGRVENRLAVQQSGDAPRTAP